MKRNLLIVSIILVSILLGCSRAPLVPPQEEEVAESTVTPPPREWSEEQSEEIANQLLRSSPTFASRGIKESLKLLSTTPLDHPFSWQFNYEFQCQYPGYGWLGSEPTPPTITPHKAQIVVQEGKVR